MTPSDGQLYKRLDFKLILLKQLSCSAPDINHLYSEHYT
jgi:hypothetical protein